MDLVSGNHQAVTIIVSLSPQRPTLAEKRKPTALLYLSNHYQMTMLSLCLLFLAVISPAHAAVGKSTSRDAQAPFDPWQQNAHLCGDRRLGPVNIKAVLTRLRYPPEDGFKLDACGKPIKHRLTLTPGTLVDRFGAEGGTFVSPCGTPYEKRSLPPATDPR
ncbi:hypothetical protein OCS_02757 [Ophiocordyceps sinensis CO18]|uniref:TNT domain-containing protein n=1 Tax=Ophiocordyceps sinensis (strain Co18 / CGMCC 3.14243) TaxID=911162 RepID=T5AG09_OPHSC|nr:hypothetical protein OCS_02757 [Ophiocordyceps sinensis CO18]